MERYNHLNAEFQRIARRDKKAFLSNQCKEIEENNRMGKTRDLFRLNPRLLELDSSNSPKARYPGMQSQVGLMKHHYEQS